MSEAQQVVVVGLGYVGLPLAVALSVHARVMGFDVDPRRIAELERGHDRTREISPDQLAATSLELTADPARCAGADIYIVTVPTPIDGDRRLRGLRGRVERAATHNTHKRRAADP